MSKLTSLEDLIARQSPELQEAANQEYRKLLKEEEDLKSLRILVRETQAKLAEKIGAKQSSISKLERKSDMSLKNLRAIVHHLGGELDIVVRLPDRSPIRLTKLSDASVPSNGGSAQRVKQQPTKRLKPRKPGPGCV